MVAWEKLSSNEQESVLDGIKDELYEYEQAIEHLEYLVTGLAPIFLAGGEHNLKSNVDFFIRTLRLCVQHEYVYTTTDYENAYEYFTDYLITENLFSAKEPKLSLTGLIKGLLDCLEAFVEDTFGPLMCDLKETIERGHTSFI